MRRYLPKVTHPLIVSKPFCKLLSALKSRNYYSWGSKDTTSYYETFSFPIMCYSIYFSVALLFLLKISSFHN